MRSELRRLRRVALPAAGIPRRAKLHVSENGFPTGPTRRRERAGRLLTAAIKAVLAVRRSYGVSDYRWFGLRDANSSEPSFEAQYGVLRDDYTPKPGFEALRELIPRSAPALTGRPRPAKTPARAARGRRELRGSFARAGVTTDVQGMLGSDR